MLGREEPWAGWTSRRNKPDLSFRAVAFADIVGSTALVEQHELDAFRCVRRVLGMLRRRARTCGGRVIDEAGDGALVSFASAAEAIIWSLGCHRALTRSRSDPFAPSEIQLRIGVHAGPVLVYGPRLFGRTITVACRLQQAAAPGDTLVSSAVADAAAHSQIATLQFAPAGDVPLKGTTVRVAAFRVTDQPASWAETRPSGSRRHAVSTCGLAVSPA